MTPTLTPDTILALAPDPGSAASARKLATPVKWQHLNHAGGLLWGECQGSGKDPYLTGVDPSGPVSRCSCPSRKFPCKHGLALMLLHAAHPGDFGTAAAPESLQTWLAGRQTRAEKAAGTPEPARAAPTPAPDPAAQARRRAARERKVESGLAALHVFLKDLVRDGLAHASARPYSDWDTQAARLVDAQAPGAARHVRRIPELLGDPAALLAHLGWLALLCEGWTHRAGLTPTELADLRAALGFPLDQAGLQAEPGVSGRWTVLGQSTTQEDHLTTRRTWLERAGHTALLLDFAAGGRPLPPGLPTGQSVQAQLVFAPSATPQRAVLRGEATEYRPAEALPAGLSVDALLDRHATLLGRNPWLERAAYALGPVRLLPGEPWHAVDDAGHALPLGGSERAQLTLMAVSGGAPLTLYGEWTGHTFTPLSHLAPGHLTPGRVTSVRAEARP